MKSFTSLIEFPPYQLYHFELKIFHNIINLIFI